jgi:hypothetical protein
MEVRKFEPKPIESGASQNDRIPRTSAPQLLDSRGNVSANFLHPQIWANPQQLSGTAHAACGDGSTRRQGVNIGRTLCEQNVARVRALEDRSHGERGWNLSGQIFQTMDSDIDRPLKQKLLDFFCEKPFETGRGFSSRLNLGSPIPRRHDLCDLDRDRQGLRAERFLEKVDLRQSKSAAARSDDQRMVHER